MQEQVLVKKTSRHGDLVMTSLSTAAAQLVAEQLFRAANDLVETNTPAAQWLHQLAMDLTIARVEIEHADFVEQNKVTARQVRPGEGTIPRGSGRRALASILGTADNPRAVFTPSPGYTGRRRLESVDHPWGDDTPGSAGGGL